jgi:probable addiction module antidote protein
MTMIEVRNWDIAECLRNEEDMAEYIRAAIDEGDAKLLASALGDVARARGMSQIARDIGIPRDSLYKGLSGPNPSYDVLHKVLNALGFDFDIKHKPATV